MKWAGKIPITTPDTPRVAAGVAGVPDGTPLAVTYQTTEAELRKQVAELVSADLNACGIQTSIEFRNPGELFGPGPDGVVFGRKFDLVQFSWEASARPNCLLYSTNQVPDAANHWIGANVTGYSSEAFDAACVVRLLGATNGRRLCRSQPRTCRSCLRANCRSSRYICM